MRPVPMLLTPNTMEDLLAAVEQKKQAEARGDACDIIMSTELVVDICQRLITLERHADDAG